MLKSILVLLSFESLVNLCCQRHLASLVKTRCVFLRFVIDSPAPMTSTLRLHCCAMSEPWHCYKLALRAVPALGRCLHPSQSVGRHCCCCCCAPCPRHCTSCPHSAHPLSCLLIAGSLCQKSLASLQMAKHLTRLWWTLLQRKGSTQTQMQSRRWLHTLAEDTHLLYSGCLSGPSLARCPLKLSSSRPCSSMPALASTA